MVEGVGMMAIRSSVPQQAEPRKITPFEQIVMRVNSKTAELRVTTASVLAAKATLFGGGEGNGTNKNPLNVEDMPRYGAVNCALDEHEAECARLEKAVSELLDLLT